MEKFQSWFGVAVRAIVVLFGLLVLFLPWFHANADSPILSGLDALLSLQCHRVRDRTIILAGTPMAVCSRCTGIYIGAVIGMALARPRWHSLPIMAWTAVTMLIVVSDVFFEWSPMGQLGQAVRLITGLILAWPVAAAAARILSLEQPGS